MSPGQRLHLRKDLAVLCEDIHRSNSRPDLANSQTQSDPSFLMDNKQIPT